MGGREERQEENELKEDKQGTREKKIQTEGDEERGARKEPPPRPSLLHPAS